MKLQKTNTFKFYLFFIILTIFLALFLTSAISLEIGKPIGSDFWFHLEIAKAYANGELALFEEKFMNPNMGPYPPLFHLFLAPFAKLGIAVQFATFLQVVFYPLAMFTSVFLAWKKMGIQAASYTSVMLLSSVAFFDRSMQVIPQAFDMIFFPLVVYFFLEKRRIPFLVSTIVMVYSHGMFGFLLLGSLILFSLKFGIGRGMVRDSIVAALPVIVLTLAFLPSYLSSSIGGIQNPQERLIAQNPLFAISYIGWVPFLLFLISLPFWFYKRNKMGKFEILLLLWLAALIPMTAAYPDRFCTYAVVPMSMAASKLLTKKFPADKNLYGLFFLALIFAVAMFTYMNWWYMLEGSGTSTFDVS